MPPEYSERGILPPPLFVNELMTFLDKPYYAGLLSAAAMHGAGHQQPQEFFLVTVKPAMRQIQCKGVLINFITKSNMPQTGLEQRKTDTGFITVSGPELTALDLVQFENRIGGLNRVTTVLEELVEKLDATRLKEFLTKTNVATAYLQRFGFILGEALAMQKLAGVVDVHLQSKEYYRIALKPDAPKTGYRMDKRWKVFVNTTLESDF